MLAIEAALSIIPRWMMVAVMVALVGWGSIIGAQRNAAQRSLAVSQRVLAEERLAAEVVSEKATQAARSEEGRRAAEQALNLESERAKTETARDALARSDAAADRLRSALSIAARTLRATGGRSQDPATISASETGARAAELLGACVDQYRAVAAAADRHRIAGELCQADYDALSVGQNNQQGR